MTAAMAWLPLLLPVGTGVTVLALDMYRARRAAVSVAFVGLALAGAVAVFGVTSDLRPLAGVFVTGRWVSAISVALLLLSATAVLASLGGAERHRYSAQTAALACLSAAGAVAAVSATDLVMLVIALEVMALCAYGLTGAVGTTASREAAMKYLVQGAIAAGLAILLLAVVAAAGAGSFAYDALAKPAASPLLTGVIVVLLVSLLAYKSSAFPFHSWAPDAYQAADPVSAGYMAAVPKAAALVVAGVVVSRIAGGGRYAVVAALVATSSIVFGNLAALRQRSYRRMLAYSAIAHAGYALTGLVSGSGKGADAIVVYAVVYGLSALAAFLVEPALRETHPEWDGSIGGMAGLVRRRPLVAACAAAAMLSLTGIPLTAGFWGKLAVFSSFAYGPWLWLAIVAVLGSVVSFGYYGRVLRAMYLDNALSEPEGGGAAGAATIALVAVSAAVVLVGLIPLATGSAWLFSMLGLPIG